MGTEPAEGRVRRGKDDGIDHGIDEDGLDDDALDDDVINDGLDEDDLDEDVIDDGLDEDDLDEDALYDDGIDDGIDDDVSMMSSMMMGIADVLDADLTPRNLTCHDAHGFIPKIWVARSFALLGNFHLMSIAGFFPTHCHFPATLP
jgi:hypothetical protein